MSSSKVQIRNKDNIIMCDAVRANDYVFSIDKTLAKMVEMRKHTGDKDVCALLNGVYVYAYRDSTVEDIYETYMVDLKKLHNIDVSSTREDKIILPTGETCLIKLGEVQPMLFRSSKGGMLYMVNGKGKKYFVEDIVNKLNTYLESEGCSFKFVGLLYEDYSADAHGVYFYAIPKSKKFLGKSNFKLNDSGFRTIASFMRKAFEVSICRESEDKDSLFWIKAV